MYEYTGISVIYLDRNCFYSYSYSTYIQYIHLLGFLVRNLNKLIIL